MTRQWFLRFRSEVKSAGRVEVLLNVAQLVAAERKPGESLILRTAEREYRVYSEDYDRVLDRLERLTGCKVSSAPLPLSDAEIAADLHDRSAIAPAECAAGGRKCPSRVPSQRRLPSPKAARGRPL